MKIFRYDPRNAIDDKLLYRFHHFHGKAFILRSQVISIMQGSAKLLWHSRQKFISLSQRNRIDSSCVMPIHQALSMIIPFAELDRRRFNYQNQLLDLFRADQGEIKKVVIICSETSSSY
jgi:hypothetical protein